MVKIQDVSTEKLVRRRKFFMILTGIYVGAAVVVIGLTLLDFLKKEEYSSTQLILGLVLLVSSWIPIVPLRAIRTELNRRAMEE